MKLLVLLAFIMLPNTGYTLGNSTAGGGDVFICDENGKTRVLLADTYFLFRGQEGEQLLRTLSSGDKEQDKQNILRQLTETHPLDTDDLKKALNRIVFEEFIPTAKQPRLPEQDNDYLEVPPGCEKRQLAIQDFRGIKSIHLLKDQVWYDTELHDQMYSFEQALFELHEGEINLEEETDDTTRVQSKILSYADKTITLHSPQPPQSGNTFNPIYVNTSSPLKGEIRLNTDVLASVTLSITAPNKFSCPRGFSASHLINETHFCKKLVQLNSNTRKFDFEISDLNIPSADSPGLIMVKASTIGLPQRKANSVTVEVSRSTPSGQEIIWRTSLSGTLPQKPKLQYIFREGI